MRSNQVNRYWEDDMWMLVWGFEVIIPLDRIVSLLVRFLVLLAIASGSDAPEPEERKHCSESMRRRRSKCVEPVRCIRKGV